jgi:transcriptional regulator with XRE-family HTH domain
MNNFAEALTQTMEFYKISAKDLSDASGVRAATISDFRLGKINPQVNTIEALLNALPQSAKSYMLFKVFLRNLNGEDIATLLYAIASELRKDEEKSNPITKPTFEMVLR